MKTERPMPEIKPEYPEGQKGIEMELVKMLGEHRSWAEYRDIGTALRRIRYDAKNMRKEHEHLATNSPDNKQKPE